MYNELIKKISEADTPFQPMAGDELARMEAEDKLREEAEKKKREEEEKKRKEAVAGISFLCPSCGVDLREDGVTEESEETRYQQLVWDERSSYWEWGDSDYGNTDHNSWNCNKCNNSISRKAFDPNGDLIG